MPKTKQTKAEAKKMVKEAATITFEENWQDAADTQMGHALSAADHDPIYRLALALDAVRMEIRAAVNVYAMVEADKAFDGRG